MAEQNQNNTNYSYENYNRPEFTLQDYISNDRKSLEEKLENFIQVHPENYKDIEPGIWIKYISNEGKYRCGGILVHNSAPDFFKLKNPYKKGLSWSVNLSKNIIFMKDIGEEREKMIEKNNLYRLYLAGYVKILEEPDPDFFN